MTSIALRRPVRLLPLALLGFARLQGCAAAQDPSPPTTPTASTRPAAAPLAEVPFTLHQNAVIVPAVINGNQPVQLLLDTGWGPLAMVSTSAQRLKLPLDAPRANNLRRAQVTSLAIGDAVVSNPVVEVFPAEELAPLIGPHDGVLSTAFFRDMVLQIDYPAGVVRFFKSWPVASAPSGGAADNASTTVPMVLAPRIGALPFTDAIRVDGKAARALFDTGGAGGFLAMPQLVERAGLQPLPEEDGPRVGIGMLSDGQMVQQRVQFAKVGRIEVGSIAVDSPRVILAPAALAGDDWGHDLIIGYGFMRNYVVTFDYPGRTVTLTRPPSAGGG